MKHRKGETTGMAEMRKRVELTFKHFYKTYVGRIFLEHPSVLGFVLVNTIPNSYSIDSVIKYNQPIIFLWLCVVRRCCSQMPREIRKHIASFIFTVDPRIIFK